MADSGRTQQWTAEALVPIAAKMLGRKVTGREVRGIVRGGGVVKRLDSRPKGGGNRVHLFSIVEARAILTVLAERQAARTGQAPVRLPAPFGSPARRSTAPKTPRASVKPVETQTTTDGAE